MLVQCNVTQAPDGALLVSLGQRLFRYYQGASEQFDAPAEGVIAARSRDDVYLLPHRNLLFDDVMWRWQNNRWTPIVIARNDVAQTDYLLATPFDVVIGSSMNVRAFSPSQVIHLYRSRL
jgi:hypothetical protein